MIIMSTFIAQYKQKWQQLNNREQALVATMSIVVLVFLFYSLVWQPLNTQLIKSTKKLARQQQLLTWVQKNTATFKQIKQQGKSSGGSLTSIVNRSAKQKSINVTRMQPQGDDLQVWLDEIPFDQLLLWLEQLANKHGLIIKALDISGTDKNGFVQVRRLQLGKR
jgi:general secretion pathway protein M